MCCLCCCVLLVYVVALLLECATVDVFVCVWLMLFSDVCCDVLEIRVFHCDCVVVFCFALSVLFHLYVFCLWDFSVLQCVCALCFLCVWHFVCFVCVVCCVCFCLYCVVVMSCL